MAIFLCSELTISLPLKETGLPLAEEELPLAETTGAAVVVPEAGRYMDSSEG